jgi:hypothetical protein
LQLTHHAQEPFISAPHHNPHFPPPLGTATSKGSTQRSRIPKMSIIRTRQNSMQHPRSSQPQSLHHHAFEHSEFSTIMLHGLHRSTGQTTHCQKPGPAHQMSPSSSPAHAPKRTKTYSP